MTTRKKPTPNKTTANPLMIVVALLAIFAVTAIITFGGRRALARSLNAQPTQADLLQARTDAVAAIPQLPKDTEEKLAAALYPTLAPVTAAFSDPVARAGTADLTIQPARTAINALSIKPANPIAPPPPEKLARLTQWQQSVRAATSAGLIPPSITTAYLISEVRPTGRLNMKGNLGAWLYIDAEKRQIPANVGAKFYDGVLSSIDPDAATGGVAFRTAAGTTTILHWDRQEDSNNTSPIGPMGQMGQPANISGSQPQLQPQTTEAPQTQQPAKPVSSNYPAAGNRDNYADLQIAVRDRYRQNLPGDGLSNAASSFNQIPRSVQANPVTTPEGLKTSSTQNSFPRETASLVLSPANKSQASKPEPLVQPEPESLSTPPVIFRANKLNYAHAIYRNTPSRFPTTNATLPRAQNSTTFNLDDPQSFNPHPSLNSVTPLHQTTQFAQVDQLGQLDQEKIQPKAPAIPQSTEPATDPDANGKDEANAANKTGKDVSAQLSQNTPAHHAAPPTTATNSTPPDPKRGTLCDPTFRGEAITITNESNRPLSLLNLVSRLNEAYGPNIVLDYDVQEIPIRLTISSAPWTSILRTLLDLNDLDMVCLDGGIVQIAKRSKIAAMGDLRRRSAPVIREVFKLKYLQQTAGGRANLAGQTQASNGATIQSLEDAIRDILKAGGDPRGEARRVPGRNQLLVAATHEQMEEIRDLIARVDRPGYQVKISALVYTANENRLRDIGSQLSIVVGNSGGTNLTGGATLAATQTTTTTPGGGASNGPPSGLNPGGIPGLPKGMRTPSNGLGASTPLATFGLSSLFGTAQFAYQLTLALQKGIVNIQSRPFGIVSDGDTFDLVAGTQIPVVTTTIAGGAPFQAGQVQFIEASRIARITPQVAEDEQGKPNFVTLNIQLENNSVDTSLGTFNGVPGVNRQSLQTVLRLKDGETVVIGGLSADQVSASQSSVPGLGSIPVLGNLFKRKTNQETRDRLYFAITVQVIPQDSPIPNFKAPADAVTVQPPPPSAQKPSPFLKHN